MNAMIQSILLLLKALIEIVGVGLLLLGLLYLLFPFAVVSRVEPSGRKRKVGYLWKIKGEYILYDSILPIFSTSRIGFVRGYEVRPLVVNVQQNKVQKTLGTFTDDGKVFDLTGRQVASCETPGQTSTKVVDDKGDSVGYVLGSLRAKQDLMVRAAGFAVLREREQAESTVFDIRVGIMDLMLPSALIYMILFYPLMLLTENITESFPAFYMLLMLLWYALIVIVFYVVKYEKTMKNDSIEYLVGLIDRNVGVGGWNILILIAAFLAFRVADGSMYPLFAVILIGFLCNLSCFNGAWRLAEPSSSWSGRIPAVPSPQSVPSGNTQVTRDYSWKEPLAFKGITSEEGLQLSFTESDFNGVNATVRLANPFRNRPVTTEADLAARTKEVLAGANTSDGCEDTAIARILNSAYQITLQHGLADFEMYDLLLGFVQSNIHYETDDKSESIGKVMEYFRYACETLYDKEGDCDCKSVLAYRLFKRLGVDVDLVEVESGETSYRNHVAIVLHNNPSAKVQLPPEYAEYAPGKGVYCESTGTGFRPGDVPGDVKTDSIVVIS